MKKREIDSKLLEKYVNNLCTADERHMVEQWLHSASFDDNTEIPASFEEDKDRLKTEIWNSLIVERKHPSRKISLFSRPSFRYTASAAIVLILISFVFFQKMTSLYQQQSLSQIVHVFDHPTFIPVDNDTEITFVSENLSQKVICKEGNTYLAIRVKFKAEEELLIVNEKDIQNLPPFLNQYITSQIKG